MPEVNHSRHNTKWHRTKKSRFFDGHSKANHTPTQICTITRIDEWKVLVYDWLCGVNSWMYTFIYPHMSWLWPIVSRYLNTLYITVCEMIWMLSIILFRFFGVEVWISRWWLEIPLAYYKLYHTYDSISNWLIDMWVDGDAFVITDVLHCTRVWHEIG